MNGNFSSIRWPVHPRKPDISSHSRRCGQLLPDNHFCPSSRISAEDAISTPLLRTPEAAGASTIRIGYSGLFWQSQVRERIAGRFWRQTKLPTAVYGGFEWVFDLAAANKFSGSG